MATYQEQKNLHQSINGIMHINDPEVSFLNQSIERKKEHVALLQIEITTMKKLQDEIERIYLREISPLEAKLKRMRRRLKDGDSHRDDKEENLEEEIKQKQEQAKKNKPKKKKEKNEIPFDEKKARVLFRSLAKKFHPDTVHDEVLKVQYEAIFL